MSDRRPGARRPVLADPLWRVVAVLAVTGAVLLVAGLVLGLVLVGRHGGGPIQGWDGTVWRWSIDHRGSLVGVDKVIAKAGDAAQLGPLCALVGIIMFAIGALVTHPWVPESA